ncbi:MAG: hypothetical protein ACLQU2_30130 [Candidatus Binataceae bacterium]
MRLKISLCRKFASPVIVTFRCANAALILPITSCFFGDLYLAGDCFRTENDDEEIAGPCPRREGFLFEGVEIMKLHWSPNMMTFVGSLILALVASLAFVALVRGEGGAAFAFITMSMIGTGMLVAGVLLKHDLHLLNDERAKAGQARL